MKGLLTLNMLLRCFYKCSKLTNGKITDIVNLTEKLCNIKNLNITPIGRAIDIRADDSNRLKMTFIRICFLIFLTRVW